MNYVIKVMVNHFSMTLNDSFSSLSVVRSAFLFQAGAKWMEGMRTPFWGGGILA
jgi:hypothetical protein